MSPHPSNLVLHNRASLGGRRSRTELWVSSVAAVGIVAVAIIGMIYIGGRDLSWDKLGDRFLRKITENPWEPILMFLGMLIVSLQMAYLAMARKHERLILTDLGIEYISPLPASLQFMQTSWSLQWSQVRHAEWKRRMIPHGPELLMLTLDAGLVKRSLRPYMWVDPANYSPPSLKKLFLAQRPDPQSIVAQVMDSPLMRFISNLPHIKIAPPDPQAMGPFSLEKNPWALAFVVAFFTLIVYAFVDAIVSNPETYVGQPFYEYYVLGGSLMTALGVWLMRRAQVPWGETVVVAVLAGGAFGAALYPGMLRLNQLSDVQGLQTYAYIMRQPAHFVPVSEGLPALQFPQRHHEFWSQYAAGREERFELRKGGLGFYQINMQPVYNRIRDYYEKK